MQVDWIAVDWGTSNLRIWAMDNNSNVLQEKSTKQGAKTLSPNEFESVFIKNTQHWLTENKTMPVIACGMIGSKNGWHEAPYTPVPMMPTENKSIQIPNTNSKIDVRIISGVKQETPADIMRGEETQIAGLLYTQSSFKGVACLPGTHSKWAKIKDSNITEFKTALTGELFALLSQQSTLSHSTDNWDEGVFIDTVKTSCAQIENISNLLFQIRAQYVLHADIHSLTKLSAILISLELAGVKSFWQNNKITIIGKSRLATLYEIAIKTIGGSASTIDANNLTLESLKQTYKRLFL